MAFPESSQEQNPGSGYFARLRQGASNMFGGNQQKPQSPNPQQQGQGKQQEDPNKPNARQAPENNGNNDGGGNPNGPQQSWLEELYTKNSPDPEQAPSFSLNEETLGKVVGSQNFTSDISDEDIQKIQGGDWNHLKTMMNKVGQGAYKAALQHGSTLTDKFVGARFEHSDKHFNSKVRKNSVEGQLSTLPNYSNPAVKAHLNDIADRLQRQHPDAPPQEIAQEAQRLLMEIADGVNPENTPEAKQRKEKAGKTDWDAWLQTPSHDDFN